MRRRMGGGVDIALLEVRRERQWAVEGVVITASVLVEATRGMLAPLSKMVRRVSMSDVARIPSGGEDDCLLWSSMEPFCMPGLTKCRS
jgi:hypothetical protein